MCFGLGGSPSDGTVCVTGSTADLNQTAQLLNSGVAALPVPVTGRWTVTWLALLAAQAAGNRALLVSTTA